MGSRWISKEKIEQRVYIYLCCFAFANVLTIPVSNVFMGLMAAGLVHRLVRYHDDWREIWQRQRTLAYFVGFILLAILLSLPKAHDPALGIRFFFNDYIYRLILPMAVLVCVHETDKIINIAICFFAAMFVNELCTIYQGIKTYPQIDRDAGFAGIMPWACLLTMFIPICFLGIRYCKKTAYKWSCMLIGASSVIALILNSTRGAWLAVMLVLPIIMILSLRSVRKFLGCFLLASIIVGAAYQNMPTFQARVQSIMNPAEQSNVERRLLWESSVNMFLDHPLTGVGFAQFQENYQNHYVLPQAKERKLPHAHNNFFQFLAEGGILGFCSLCMFCGYLLYVSLRGWIKYRQPVYLVLLAVVLGFFLHGMTEYTLRLARCSKAFWLCLGLCFQWINLLAKGRECDDGDL